MNLELRGFFRFLPLFVFPFFLIVGSFGTIQAFDEDFLLAKIFTIIWMGVVVYNILKFSKMVVHIQLMDNNKIIFKTILGKEYELFTTDFISIKVNNNMIDFKTNSGNYISFGNYDGFSEFIVALKSSNSNLVTKGC
jgi:hypothetical protein